MTEKMNDFLLQLKRKFFRTRGLLRILCKICACNNQVFFLPNGKYKHETEGRQIEYKIGFSTLQPHTWFPEAIF